MSDDAGTPLDKASTATCEVRDGQRTARIHLPPRQLAGVRKPISIYLDMDTEAVDALLRQVAEIRMQMLPAPRRN